MVLESIYFFSMHNLMKGVPHQNEVLYTIVTKENIGRSIFWTVFYNIFKDYGPLWTFEFMKYYARGGRSPALRTTLVFWSYFQYCIDYTLSVMSACS